MLIEVKMTDGEKMRMKADEYRIDVDSGVYIIERRGWNAFFNAARVMYVRRVDNLYGGDEV